MSTDAYASQIGAQVLRSGENAVDPAIATSFALAVVELAEGFEIQARQAYSLSHSAEALRTFAATAAKFLPNDSVPGVGTSFSQPDLAATLTRIRDDGRDGF